MTTDEMLWAIRDDRSLSSKAKTVWVMLLARGEHCCPTVATIAADCGISKPTARAALAELSEAGWLKVTENLTKEGDRDTNSYHVVRPGHAGVVKPLAHPVPETSSAQGGGQTTCPPGGQMAFPGGQTTCPEDNPLSRRSPVKEKNHQPPLTDVEAEFARFYAAYPRHTGRKGARSMYERALKHATPEVILAGAVRYAADPNRVDEFTKHPSTWLHQGCWDDDPLPSRGNVRRLDQPQPDEEGWVQPVTGFRSLD